MTDRSSDPGRPPLPCVRCGYLADTSAGPLNFCPKCGLDLRPGAAAEPDPTTSAYLGQVIADRYKLVALLGEGGMGAVFRAEHVRMGKALAVKLLRGGFAQDETAVARFQAEARIVSRLSHPHTIAVFDFGNLGEGEGFYLAMEYVPGKDLAALLRQRGKLPELRAISIAEQLLGSLAEAHQAGVVHRDVKPANVMLRETGEGDFVKVLDFGIAKLRDVPGSDTAEGAILGTPSYLAPEQARGQEIDARADLYSVGAVLYELVSGRCPFVSRSPLAVMQAHITQAPPPLRVVAPWVSEGLGAVIHRALQKDPARRFQTAAEMRRALLALGVPSSSGLLAPPVPASLGADLASRADFEEFERQRRRLSRAESWVPIAAVLALVLALAVLWRWTGFQAFLARRLPEVARLLPASLRPAGALGGREREPNDTPAQANPVAFPPGEGGQPAGGTAEVAGSIGARLGASAGDVDVFRLEVPEGVGRRALVAEWSGSKAGDGIPGLAVALTLNRVGPGDGGRRPAPLVAQAGGAPGRPVRLASLVETGTYYLAVREVHPEGSPPVERPGEPYRLRISLAEPRPGEEVEPDDDPGPGRRRYPEWRALAGRNPLGEGQRIEGETSRDDPDAFAVGPRGPSERTSLVVLLPSPELALTAQRWLPDAADLDPAARGDRERFVEAGDGAPGELVAVRLDPPPAGGAPAIVRLRARAGQGRYQVLALGPGTSSGRLAISSMEALAAAGRGPQALELAAAFAREIPDAAPRTEVLAAAGRLAERIAAGPGPIEIGEYDAAARRLGVAIFEAGGGRVRYGSAFESLADGSDALAEEALARAALRVLPCTPDEVRRRAQAYLARFPRSRAAASVRMQLARALEEQYWQGGARESLRGAAAAYAAVARSPGPAAAEAAERALDLSRPRPARPAVTRLRCE